MAQQRIINIGDIEMADLGNSVLSGSFAFDAISRPEQNSARGPPAEIFCRAAFF